MIRKIPIGIAQLNSAMMKRTADIARAYKKIPIGKMMEKTVVIERAFKKMRGKTMLSF